MKRHTKPQPVAKWDSWGSLSSSQDSYSSVGANYSSPSVSTTTDGETYDFFPTRQKTLPKTARKSLRPNSWNPNLPARSRSQASSEIPRCSSRKSLLAESDMNELYSQIHKQQPKPDGPRARKRVCFRPAGPDLSRPLAAIQESSPVSKSRDFLPPPPHPSPLRSPTKVLPKTNPYYTLPRMHSGATLEGRQRNISYAEAIWGHEKVSTYYDTDDSSWSVDQMGNTSRSQGDRNRTMSMQRVISGLKSFGIKGSAVQSEDEAQALRKKRESETEEEKRGGGRAFASNPYYSYLYGEKRARPLVYSPIDEPGLKRGGGRSFWKRAGGRSFRVAKRPGGRSFAPSSYYSYMMKRPGGRFNYGGRDYYRFRRADPTDLLGDLMEAAEDRRRMQLDDYE